VDPPEGPPPSRKLKKPKRLARDLIAPVILVVLTAGGFFGYYGVVPPYNGDDAQPEQHIEKTIEQPLESQKVIEIVDPPPKVSGAMIKAFISGATGVSYDTTSFESELEKELDPDNCLSFLHLAQFLLKTIESMKPLEQSAESERAKALRRLKGDVAEGIKNEVEEADFCRKLIEGVAKYAVDAARNKGSRSRN
jgi:hypothetical protein